MKCYVDVDETMFSDEELIEELDSRGYKVSEYGFYDIHNPSELVKFFNNKMKYKDTVLNVYLREFIQMMNRETSDYLLEKLTEYNLYK